MPILNKRLLLRLVVLLLVLAGSLFGVHRVQANRVPTALLWHANNAAEKGKTDKAIAYMRQYLEFRPDDHDQAVKLGEMILDRATTYKDYTNAHFLFEKILREAPQRDDVARKLVTLCLLLGRSEDALIHAERLLKQTPNDGVLLGQLAECQMLQNKPDAAKQSFEAALATNPKIVRPYDQYARLLVRHFNKPQEAGNVLDRMCHANPGSAEAFLLRAKHWRAENKAAECLRDLERVLLHDPENADALVLLAEVEQGRGNLRRAKSTLAALIATYPRDVRGYRALSWLNLVTGNQADAIACLEQGTRVLPDAPELLTPLADIWIEQGETERATTVVKKLESRKDAQPQWKYLRGRLMMKEGKWNEALAILDGLRTEAMAMQGLAQQLNLLVAACHERRGDQEAQRDALKRILAADPTHLAGRVALGNAYLASGSRELALKEYQAAARIPYASTAVWLTYANLRMSLAKEKNANADEWRNVRTLLMELRRQHKHVLEPILMQAEVEAYNGQWVAALKIVRDECQRRPEDPRLWSALADLTARGQGTMAAAQVLSEAQLAVGDSVELKLARARLWMDDPFAGRTQRLAELERTGYSEAEQLRLLRGLFDIYQQLGDDAGQLRIGQQLLARQPQQLSLCKALYALALKVGDAGGQNRWRQEIRKLEGATGRSHVILEGLALVDTLGPNDRAMNDLADAAQAVLQSTPDDLDALLLQAKLAERRDNANLANSLYERCFALEPTLQRTQTAWLGYLLRHGSDEQLKTAFLRMTHDPRLSLAKLRLSFEATCRQANVNGVVRLVNQLGWALQREPRLLLWGGQILEQQGKVTDALAFYKAATTAYPSYVDGWSVRTLASARLGKKEVTDVVQEAQSALGVAYFTYLAEVSATVQNRVPDWKLPIDKSDAWKPYAQALMQVSEARQRLGDVLPVLEQLGKNMQAPEADRVWATRTMAALLAAHGSPEQRQQALQQLRANNSPTISLEDARSRIAALMVAMRANGGDDRKVVVREMVQLLDRITSDPQATANDWFTLAQLHRMMGDRATSRKALEAMLKLEPNNRFFLAVNVDDLLSENRLEEARSFIPKLQQGTHDIRVTACLGRYYTLMNDGQAVLETVEQFVRIADPGTTDRNMRERQAAELLDQLARIANMRGLACAKAIHSGAGERYRIALKAYPDAIVPYTAMLAYVGDVKPAFDDLERYKKRLTPATLVLAGVGVLRSGFAEPAQFQLVQEWIDASLAENPDSIPMKLNLAELHTLRQDFAVAERLYRDVLTREPKNGVALNNLAWILAPKPEAATQALNYAEQAIALYEATAEMLDTRARILIAAGKYDRAIVDLNDAINQGQTPLRYFHLAIAYAKMGNQAEANKAFVLAKARGLDAKAIHPYDLPLFKQLAESSTSN